MTNTYTTRDGTSQEDIRASRVVADLRVSIGLALNKCIAIVPDGPFLS